MALATSTKLLFAVVAVLIALVLYQLVGLGRQVEAMSNPVAPPNEIRQALGEHMLRQSSLKTARPNLWVHLTTNPGLPMLSGTQLAGAAPATNPIDKVASLEQLCAYTTLFHNNSDFNVICITDHDLPLLLPGWNVNLDAIPEGPRGLVRQIALLRVVYYYGGLLVPSTFACTAPLASIMSSPSSIAKEQIVAFEAETTGMGAQQEEDGHERFGPSARFMYSAPLNPTVRVLIDALSVRNTTEAQVSAFEDHASVLMNRLKAKGKVNTLPGELVGTKTAHGTAVTVAESLDGFDRAQGSVGVWIPLRVFEVRKYGWLIREAPQKILLGSTWLAEQLRQSLSWP
jgi:hypothetical protein